MTSLHVERIDAPAGLQALESEWRALERRANCTLPFYTFDWICAWWTHLREDKLAVRDELRVYAMRDACGILVAVAPMMLTCRPARGPVRARELQFLGSDPNVTELRGLLAEPRYLADAFRTLLATLARATRDWDWLTISGVPVDHSLVEDEIAAQVGTHAWVREVPDYVLPLPATWDDFRAGLSRNIKESLRKCYNAPKRDGLQFEMEVARDASQIDAALRTFLRLHHARSKMEDGVQHRDVFASVMARRFLLQVAEQFAKRDCLRVFTLTSGGVPVAARVGFVVGDSLYLYYSGFDPAYGKYSVMTRTVAEAIQYAIGEGLSSVNLSTGTDVSKTRWGPREIRYRDAFVISPRKQGALKRFAYTRVRRLVESRAMRVAIGRHVLRRGA